MTTEISGDELHRALSGAAAPTLAEALGAAFFEDAHLPDAINVPPDQVDRLAATLLPDRKASIVVYCSGTRENSEIAARRLEELGYGSVRVHFGGKEDWVEHGLPVERTSDD